MGSEDEIETPAGFRDPAKELGPAHVVIVGAGLAGLFTALRLSPLPVTIVAAAPLGEGASSVWAQGGIAAAVGKGDTPEKHAADTIAAGCGLVDEHIAHMVASEAPARIRDLLSYGVPFDRDGGGFFMLSREAAHSMKRVVRVSGDRAGAAIMQALIGAVRKTPSIRVLERYVAEDLIITAGSGAGPRVTGVRLARWDADGRGLFDLIPASAVVVATGGIGALYDVTTNPPYARGEAIAFAARAGAVIADAEFVQFHPTAIDADIDPAPLASEALRGEGAILVNDCGERFMQRLDPRAELAPRDVVARGVFAEIVAGRGAYLDCRTSIGRNFPTAFPTVYAYCRAAGIDPVTDLIPVAPAAHYHMGGIATDARGRTTVEGLWAVGEVASTGLHGANRLASNSLLEAAVFGARAASDIATLAANASVTHGPKTYRVKSSPMASARREALLSRLRHTMSVNAGVLRDAQGLETALAALRSIEVEAQDDSMIANMAVAAQFVTGAALIRKESRGAHFRVDFPQAADGPSVRSYLSLDSLGRISGSSRPAAQTQAKCQTELAP